MSGVITLSDKWQWQLKKHLTDPMKYHRLLHDSKDACVSERFRVWGGRWQDLSEWLCQKGFRAHRVHVDTSVISHALTLLSRDVKDDEHDDNDNENKSDIGAEMISGHEECWYCHDKFLFQRVLTALHFVTYPTSSRSDWETELITLFHSSGGRDGKGVMIRTGDVWSWLGKEEAKGKVLWGEVGGAVETIPLFDHDASPPLPLCSQLLLSSASSLVSSFSSVLWSLQPYTYRTIFHFCVTFHDDEHDTLPLTRHLCSVSHPAPSSHVNQSDFCERTPLHEAAMRWRLSHLLVLVQHPCVDLWLVERNSRTFLHVLMLSLRVKRKKREKVDEYLLHQIIALCLEPRGCGDDEKSYAIGRGAIKEDSSKLHCEEGEEGDRRSGVCLVLLQDNCGLDVLDYAIMAGVASVIVQIVSVLEGKSDTTERSHHGGNVGTGNSNSITLISGRKSVNSSKGSCRSAEVDWLRYLRRAILCNTASTTISLATSLLNSHDIITGDHDSYNSMLAGVLSFSIKHLCHKALMALLTFKEFIRAVNTPGVLACPVRGQQQQHHHHSHQHHQPKSETPLVTALSMCTQEAGSRCMDILRVLLKFGGNPLSKPLHASCIPAVVSSSHFSLLDAVVVRDYECVSDWVTGRLKDRNRVGTEAAEFSHDNVFSYVASPTFFHCGATSSSCDLHTDAHADTDTAIYKKVAISGCSRTDVMRALLLSTRHAACLVPVFSTRAQADQSPLHPGSHTNNTSLHYFYDYAMFSRSPLVTVLLNNGSRAQRLHQLHTQAYLHTHPFRLACHPSSSPSTNNRESNKLLEYMLQHSPFVRLLDMQEGYSGVTPLAAACWARNSTAVDVLLRHGAHPEVTLNAFLANPSEIVQKTLTQSLTAWREDVQRWREHFRLPAVQAKRALDTMTEYEKRARGIRDVALAALESVEPSSLEVLATATWCLTSQQSRRDTSKPMQYTLPANSTEFFEHFIILLELMDSAKGYELSNDDNAGGEGGFTASRHFNATREENLLLLRQPASLLRRARQALLSHLHLQAMSSSELTSGVPACRSLDAGMLVRLNSMDKHYASFASTPTASRTHKGSNSSNDIHLRMVQGQAVRSVQQVVSVWGRSLLELHSLSLQLRSGQGGSLEKAGVALKELLRTRRQLGRALDEVMRHQRVHTAYNYLINDGGTNQRSCQNSELYTQLCSTQSAVERQGESGVCGLQEGNSSRYNFVGNMYCERRRRVQSRYRCDRLWWWDTISSRDWDLTLQLIPEMCLEESSAGMEDLVVLLVEKEAPINLLRRVLTKGVRLGGTTQHLKLAVRKRNPLLFLTLLLFGSFCTDSEVFWRSFYRELETKHSSVLPQCKNGGVDASVDERYRCLHEILKSGVASASSVEGGGLLLQNCGSYEGGVFTGVFTAVPSRDVLFCDSYGSGSDSGSDSDIDKNGNDDSLPVYAPRSFSRMYVNKESRVRSPLGQLVLIASGIPSQHNPTSKLGIDGVLGLNNRTLSLPVVPSPFFNCPAVLFSGVSGLEHGLSIEQSEFFDKHLQLIQPEDWFLFSPVWRSQHSCDDEDEDEETSENEEEKNLPNGELVDSHLLSGLVKSLLGGCSRLTSSLLLTALRTASVSRPSTLALPPTPVQPHLRAPSDTRSRTSTSVPAIVHAARSGHVRMVSSLLDEYVAKPGDKSEGGSVPASTGNNGETDNELKLGLEEYYRGRELATLRLDVDKLSLLMCLEGHTRWTRCKQRRDNLSSGLRGRIYHHLRPDGGSNSDNSESYAVNRVLSNVVKFVEATSKLESCEASWLGLHRAGVLSCRSSITISTLSALKPDATQEVVVGTVLAVLGVCDAFSLHAYISRVTRAPLEMCCGLVHSIKGESVDNHSYNHSVSDSDFPSSLPPSKSLSLQPLQLWQSWIHTVSELVSDGKQLRMVWSELRALHLARDGDGMNTTGSNGDGLGIDAVGVVDYSDDIEDEDEAVAWLNSAMDDEEEGEKCGGEWFYSAESVLREECFAKTNATKTNSVRTTVMHNVRFLQTSACTTERCCTVPSTRDGASSGDHYKAALSTSDSTLPRHDKKNVYFHSSTVPLLCLQIDAFSSVLQPPDSAFCDDVALLSLLSSTSKTLFHLVGSLCDLSSYEFAALSPQDRYRHLVLFSEGLYDWNSPISLGTSDDDVCGSDGFSFGGAASCDSSPPWSLLELELRDTLLAQVEETLLVRISSLRSSLQSLLDQKPLQEPMHEKQDDKAMSWPRPGPKSEDISQRSKLAAHLRTSIHLLVCMQTCRAQNLRHLQAATTTATAMPTAAAARATTSTKDVTALATAATSTTRGALDCQKALRRLSVLLLEAVRTKSSSLVNLLLPKMLHATSVLTAVVPAPNPNLPPPSMDSCCLRLRKCGSGFGGISRDVWAVACAAGDEGVMRLLLDHAAAACTGTLLPMCSGVGRGSWTLLHCALTGFSSESAAAKHHQLILSEQTSRMQPPILPSTPEKTIEIDKEKKFLSTMNGSAWFPGDFSANLSVLLSSEAANSSMIGRSGRAKRKMVRALVEAGSFFYLPCSEHCCTSCEHGSPVAETAASSEESRDGSSQYPYSVLDMCAAAGCWEAVVDLLDLPSAASKQLYNSNRKMDNPFALAATRHHYSSPASSKPALSLFFHHVVTHGREDILNLFLEKIISSKKSDPPSDYSRKLHLFGSMLASRRRFCTSCGDDDGEEWSENVHFLLHDALLIGKNERILHKLIWMTKSIHEELSESQPSESACYFPYGFPSHHHHHYSHSQAAISSRPENSLLHYAALSESHRVLKFLLMVSDKGVCSPTLPPPAAATRLTVVPDGWIRGLSCGCDDGSSRSGGSDGDCSDGLVLTPLQTALRWGGEACVLVLLAHLLSSLSAETNSTEMDEEANDRPSKTVMKTAYSTVMTPTLSTVLRDTFRLSRLDSTTACVIFHCLVRPQLKRALKTLTGGGVGAGVTTCALSREGKFYSWSESAGAASGDDSANTILSRILPMHEGDALVATADVLRYIQKCYDMQWHQSCCLLIQHHFLSLAPLSCCSQSQPQKETISSFYTQLLNASGKAGHTTVYLAILSFLRDSAVTWLYPLSPPALHSASTHPHTFCAALRYIASRIGKNGRDESQSQSQAQLEPHPQTLNITSSPDALDVTSTNTSTMDDMWFDLEQFRSLLLAHDDCEGDGDQGGSDNGGGVVNSVLALAEEDGSLRASSISGSVYREVDPIGDDNGHREDLDDKEVAGGSGGAAPLLNATKPPHIPQAPKKIIVIRTKHGKEATFFVRDKAKLAN